MAETLVKVVGWQRPPALVLRLGPCPVCWGGGLGVWMGLVVRLVGGGQASCWVLREQAPVGPVGSGWLVSRWARSVRSSNCGPRWGLCVVAVGLVLVVV